MCIALRALAVICALQLTATSALRADDEADLVVIYGSLRPEVIGRFPESGDATRRMDDGYSRVGIRGSAEVAGDMEAFYRYARPGYTAKRRRDCAA